MTDEELIERLLGGCSCNIDTSPCMAEDDCRLDMEAARRICALTEQLAAAKRDAKDAEAYAAELESSAKWQPIETAPKDGTAFLTFSRDAANNPREGVSGIQSTSILVMAWAYADPHPYPVDEHGNWHDFHCYHPTHWMPLPEAPAT